MTMPDGDSLVTMWEEGGEGVVELSAKTQKKPKNGMMSGCGLRAHHLRACMARANLSLSLALVVVIRNCGRKCCW